jgi:hypothetical protein
MMRLFLYLVLFLTSISSFYSQQIVEFTFIDKKTGESVPNVKATIQQISSSLTSSDTTGIFYSNKKGTISTVASVNSIIVLYAQHAIYEDFRQGFKVKSEGEDTLKFEILLKSASLQIIKEVVIRAPGIPDTIYGSDRLSVADFELQKNGKLVLLTYPKQLKKGGEIVLFDGKEVLSTIPLTDIPEKLIRDFRGNTHVICQNEIFTLVLSKNEVQIATIEKDYFLQYIAPIVDTNRTKMYLNNFNPVYPAFDYFTFDRIDSSYKKILHIEDDLMMELYKSEYKWVDVRTKLWAKNKEVESGISAEVWVGANYFTQSLYYEEAYAPLFHRNDSIFIFDYSKDRMLIFNVFGDVIDTVSIYHHYNPRKTGWKKNVIQDKVTGAIYAVFELNGFSYLGLIDGKTGKIDKKVKLAFKYVDKIRVNNNFVYYIYRPFESLQRKYLYREQLPYFIKPNQVFQQN